MESELETMAYNDNDPTPSTGKIERAVSHALHLFGLLEIRRNSEQAAADAKKAWKTVERLEKRELRAKAAASSSYQMEVKDED